MLSPEQLALAEERMHDPRNTGPLPASQPERFDRRVTVVMSATGRDRAWARARAAETWPDEHEAFLAAKA